MAKYEVGDEVDLRVKVLQGLDPYNFYEVDVGGIRYGTELHERQLDAGKRVPRPIKVGDTVHVSKGAADFTVEALSGRWAWLRYPCGQGFGTFELADLTRAPT